MNLLFFTYCLLLLLLLVVFFDAFTVCCLCSVFLSMYMLNPVGTQRMADFGWSGPLFISYINQF